MSKRFKTKTSVLAVLLILLTLVGFVGASASEPGDRDGKKVQCEVTSEKAFLYSDMDVDSIAKRYFKKGSRFVAYEFGNKSWLAYYLQDEKGTEVIKYISIFDLAVDFIGEREEIFPDDYEGLQFMPPDYVESDGLNMDGIEGAFAVKTNYATLRENPSLDSKILGYFAKDTDFKAVYIEDSDWIKTMVVIDSYPTVVYLYNGTIQATTTSREIAVIRITSGIVSVYSKPDIKSDKIGTVNAPVRFEGEWAKGKKWVRVELANNQKAKYGYIINPGQ